MSDPLTASRRHRPRAVLRWLLGGALIIAGVGHLTTPTHILADINGWFPTKWS